MSKSRERADLIPNANNPRLLQRLIRLVASGIRKQRALADVLQVELRTVHYYTQAGEWLGLLATDKEVHLTPRGVEYAFADPRQRARLYAKAIWSVPLVQSLLAGRGDLPEAEVITSFILEHEPSMSPRTARRRATALRGLIEPAVRLKPSKVSPHGTQLGLFGGGALPAGSAATNGRVDLRAGTEDNPDVYCRVLIALLDHGELTTGHVRALLDDMGARDCALGGYIEMALRREDAMRSGDRLVVTSGAIRRREIANDGILIALTDPAYRAYLDALIRADDAPLARRERTSLGRRFASWDLRIFGERLTEDTIGEALSRPLVGRRLEGLPEATSKGTPAAAASAPFIEMLDTKDLIIAFPSSLTALAGGVSKVNEALQRNRSAPAGVRVPGPVDTRTQVHGGLLCPGETLPRAIPDNLTLRMQLLTHAPAFALLTCLLVLDRKDDVVVRLVEEETGPMVYWGREIVGTLFDVWDRFGTDQGWLVSRPTSGGLNANQLIDVSEDLNLCSRVGKRIVLEEKLFLRLHEDAEARLIYEQILPLEDRFHAWLCSQEV